VSIGLVDKLYDTIGFVDTLNSGNPAQLVFHCVFSFWIRFCGGYSTCNSCIVLTKDCYIFCSFAHSTSDFFIGYLSLNTHSSITLLLVMAIFTSTIWTEGFETLGSTTIYFFVSFIVLFLNIFYIHCTLDNLWSYV